MADEKDQNEATTHADVYQRHEQTSEGWEEAQAVTGRPNDTPIRDPEPAPLGGNSTLASRARTRQKDEKTKQVDESDAEDKAVTSAATKTRARKK